MYIYMDLLLHFFFGGGGGLLSTGLFNSWNAFGCCGTAAAINVDDVLFLTELLDFMMASLCIDQRRVYFTGISNGALMSYRMAQLFPERIAAIGPVAGVPSEQPLAPPPFQGGVVVTCSAPPPLSSPFLSSLCGLV